MIGEGRYQCRNVIRCNRENGVPSAKIGEAVEILAQNGAGEEMIIPVTVLFVYPNGDFVGEIVWAVA